MGFTKRQRIEFLDGLVGLSSELQTMEECSCTV